MSNGQNPRSGVRSFRTDSYQIGFCSVVRAEKDVLGGIRYADLLSDVGGWSVWCKTASGVHPLDENGVFEYTRPSRLDSVQHQPRYGGRVHGHRRDRSRTNDDTATSALPCRSSRAGIRIVAPHDLAVGIIQYGFRCGERPGEFRRIRCRSSRRVDLNSARVSTEGDLVTVGHPKAIRNVGCSFILTPAKDSAGEGE